LEIREPHGIWGGLNEVERKALIAQHVGPDVSVYKTR